MSNDFEAHARSIANSSGFPLQIRVAEIASSSSRWRILFEEHPWCSEEINKEGFLDLVLMKPSHHNRDVMVIECKRVLQTEWVFLTPNHEPHQSPSHRYHACLFESTFSEGRWDSFGWANWAADPSSFESQFCAIPGQEQGRRNILERTAAELIQAIEAFSWQEKELQQIQVNEKLRMGQPLNEFRRLYIPLIITTATLIISQFDPGSISLRDGSLPPESTFVPVPVVRFRKSLTTEYNLLGVNDIHDIHEKTQRTIFIVNAEKFHEFLESWNIRQSH
jgi:hypothetical protein